ncbi:MAG: protein kinase domain-containing protein [Steroidobacteraceae bacterium]
MTASSWERVRELLHQAVALGPQARAEFLDQVCAADVNLRAELDSLLLADAQLSGDILRSTSAEVHERDFEDLAATRLTAGQLFAQRFRLSRKLGEGGMGQVWLAEQIAPVRRLVALKLIGAGMYDEAVVQRFQAERQSLAIMEHPYIAKVFDAGTTPQGQPYFVMEYVPGLPITEYCDQRRLKIRDRLEVFIQACEGVQHAHQKAIIHRDLKPANILIVEVDGVAVPRIIDFGLAKAITPKRADEMLFTRFGQFIGTPGYMSPEQVDPNIRDVDTRTDVYSLGVILYVLLTGLLPFEAQRPHKPALDVWLRQLREEEPPTMSAKLAADPGRAASAAAARSTEPKQLLGMLRGDLQWITSKSLERERERRYGLPSELIADLRRYLNHEPVEARPASAGYKLRKFIRRNRVAAVVAGVLCILALVASGSGLIALRKQHEAEFQAAQALQTQARLLTQAAAERLRDWDLTGAQDIILYVLMNSVFAPAHPPAAVGIFQNVRVADLQVAVLSGHEAKVNSAAYSPDGSRVVTASNDKTARIWDAHTGIELAELSGHEDHVAFAAYSPDGTRIVTASDDKTARVWDARTGHELTVLSGHLDTVSSAAYSPDGARIVTASDDKTARIWDARTGALLRVLAGHGGYLYYAAFSPDGTRIVTASDDKTARIWDARTGAQLRTLSGHDGIVLSAAFSPDGTRIVTASDDKTARIWDARTGDQLIVLSGHENQVISAAYSPDGTRIVTASNDRTARIWDQRTGARLAVLSGHFNYVNSAAFSPDGRHVVTASDDKTARIWDTQAASQLAMFSGKGYFFESAAFSPDGTRIVAASADKTARVWDVRTGAPLAVLSGHESYLYFAAFSPDGSRIVTASDDRTARVWDARSGAQLVVLSGHDDQVLSAAYSPDSNRIVTASTDKTARIWDARTGAELAVLSGHAKLVTFAAYSPDGTRIVTTSSDNTARIWDARSGALVTVLAGHGDSVRSAAYSPDGTRIVTASYDKTARIWDARTGKQIAVLIGHSGYVHFAAFSPDGTRIVTASYDKTAGIWDARTGAQLAALAGYEGGFYTAVYSPDGTRIVTASRDKTARIWDARIPAPLSAQIQWQASAETDPLPEVDRSELGLLPDYPVRSWTTTVSVCDQTTAAIYDPDRPAPGRPGVGMMPSIENLPCSVQIARRAHTVQSDYQMGRALLGEGDRDGARREFEVAVAGAYRAARIDLADLLVNDSQETDRARAVSLYEQAWRDNVPVAAFKLGYYYEHGSHPDMADAWRWYQQGADAGEPYALARIAERDENNAFAEPDVHDRNARLLTAFRFYAAAAERAQYEDWPDEYWNKWRYRRATLARLLAREGMMRQAADAYAAVRSRWTPRPPSLWERVQSAWHR